MSNHLVLSEFLKKHQCNAMIVTKKENIRYLSGFTGSTAMLLVEPVKISLYVDFRYKEQAKIQAPDCIIQIVEQNSLEKNLARDILEKEYKKVAFEGENITFNLYQKFKQDLEIVELVSLSLDEIRLVKSEWELSKLRKAMEIADKAFSAILPLIKPGIKENDLALELEYKMKKLGAEKNSFDTIVASGKRSALPHGRASDKIIENNDFVTIDFGAFFEGYASDMTRTVIVGKANEKQKEVYNTVLKAQIAAIESVREGKSAKEIDLVARDIITQAGYGEYFGHGLGHGVGLEVHEMPRLSPMFKDSIIKENMVFSIEPGIYIPDFGGVRIEDLVIAKKDGCEILTKTRKDLVEL